MKLTRTTSMLSRRITYQPLSHIERVYAARSGFIKDGIDHSTYVLKIVVTSKNKNR